MMIENPENREETRNPDGTFKPGISGNPGGRPKNPMKDYIRSKFASMSSEDMEKWLKEHKVSGEIQWKMAEGNPMQDTNLGIHKTISEVLDELDNGFASQE